VERQFVDGETGKPVERDEQVKGYPPENGDYIVIEGDACLKPVARQFLFGY
jgi:DNA end-binding protein Ku